VKKCGVPKRLWVDKPPNSLKAGAGWKNLPTKRIIPVAVENEKSHRIHKEEVENKRMYSGLAKEKTGTSGRMSKTHAIGAVVRRWLLAPQ
jgi:hypothetical protein